MTLFNSKKLQVTQKAQLDLLQQISSKVFESVEQLTQLQLKNLRAASGDQFENLSALLSVSNPQDFAKLQTAFTQPSVQAERLAEFNREVYELISSTHAEITKLAESQAHATTEQTQEMIETLVKNAPAGAEPAVAMFKTALESVGTTYEGVQKAAQHASKMAEEGIVSAASAAAQATGATVKSATADVAKPKATETAKPAAAKTAKPKSTEAAKPDAAKTAKPKATEAAKPVTPEAAKPAAKPATADVTKPKVTAKK